MSRPLSPVIGPGSAAVVLAAALAIAFAVEVGRDRGDVIETRIVSERHAGKVWWYAVEDGGEFDVAPIVGLLHGYPRVGDTTEVRRGPDGPTWNAWTARYPFTTMFGILAVSLGVAVVLRNARERQARGPPP